MLKTLICRMVGHRPDRRRVWNDGIDFRAQCVRCGIPMVRDMQGWRAFDPERDNEEERATSRHE